MNTPTLDFLTAAENTQIATDVAALLDDTQVSVAVTYNSFQSRTFNAAAGTTTPAWTAFSIRAIRNTLGARELAAGQGVYQAGDLVFVLDRAEMTNTPSVDDQIVLGSDTYKPGAWTTDPLGKTWRLVARRIK